MIVIVCFKRHPYLRLFSANVMYYTLEFGHIQGEWKKSYTVLVHTKGSKVDPASFSRLNSLHFLSS